ncbi:BQ2448_5085 [Microbotryum intermedium]|uniref:Cyclin-dependent kinases regulatory subunit n=1 Tax=Microbotryum intermedium TaxID=269621 RepID=A0A238F6I7_9BASI|nr:BQ2448_5085 [Microbotryum intermedium]
MHKASRTTADNPEQRRRDIEKYSEAIFYSARYSDVVCDAFVQSSPIGRGERGLLNELADAPSRVCEGTRARRWGSTLCSSKHPRHYAAFGEMEEHTTSRHRTQRASSLLIRDREPSDRAWFQRARSHTTWGLSRGVWRCRTLSYIQHCLGTFRWMCKPQTSCITTILARTIIASAHEQFEYRHVILPKALVKYLPTDRLAEEDEWRGLGIRQSPGWEHYLRHAPEPHILLFKREKDYQIK